MGLRLTIDGAEAASSIDWAVAPVVIEDLQGEPSRATFVGVLDFVPDRGDDVVIYAEDETTPIFGGFILRRQNVYGARERAAVSRCAVECVGYLSLANYCYITIAYAESVALEDVLEDIVDRLNDNGYGFSYTPTATGVTLAPFQWQQKRVSDALRELGVSIRVSPTKVISTYVPGDDSAPFDIDDSDPKCYDLKWEDEGEIPPNKITMVCGSGKRAATEQFTADGTGTTYTTSYPASQTNADPFPNQVIVDGAVVAVAGWGPDQLPAGSWYWDAPTHTLHNETGVAVSNGAVVTIHYTREDPFEVSDDTGASPVIEEVIPRADILYREQALEQIALRLATLGPASKLAHIHTREPGLAPGQAIVVDTAKRGGIDDTLIVQSVRTEIRSDLVRHYFADATSAIAVRRSYLGEWRELMSGGSGGVSGVSAMSGGGGAIVVGLQLPVSLGGSSNTSVGPSSGAWVDVPNVVPIVPSVDGSGQARVILRARDSGVTVTARLRNVTDSTDVEAASVTSQSETVRTLVSPLVAGKEYRLQVKNDSTGAGVYGLGTLQVL